MAAEDVLEGRSDFDVISVEVRLACRQSVRKVRFIADEEVVDNDDPGGALGQQSICQMAANEPGPARDEDGLAGERRAQTHPRTSCRTCSQMRMAARPST